MRKKLYVLLDIDITKTSTQTNKKITKAKE